MKYYFDMEYIPGISLIKRIEGANLEQLKEIACNLIEILNLIKSSSNNQKKFSFQGLVTKKLQGILVTEKDVNSRKAIAETISLIKGEQILNTTFCHGDLTLENIIYNEQEDSYYLIDFLDSFIDHYWQDLAKLFQDLEGQWYVFRNKEVNKTAMEIKTEIIKDILIKRFLVEDDYMKNHALLLSTTFCRILPYAKEEEKEWIRGRINKSLTSTLKIVL